MCAFELRIQTGLLSQTAFHLRLQWVAEVVYLHHYWRTSLHLILTSVAVILEGILLGVYKFYAVFSSSRWLINLWAVHDVTGMNLRLLTILGSGQSQGRAAIWRPGWRIPFVLARKNYGLRPATLRTPPWRSAISVPSTYLRGRQFTWTRSSVQRPLSTADTVAVVPIYGRRDTGAFSQCERVADFVVFDHSTNIYTIVGR